MDGIEHEVKAGGIVQIQPGGSITLEPGHLHSFWGAGGDSLVGEVSVSGLAEDYQMSFAAVQKHVAALEKAGLVKKAVVGRQRLVRADPDEIARARACLQELEALWRHRMTALDAVLSSPEE